MSKKYYILVSETYKFVWFLVPKCGSRSIRSFFGNLDTRFPREILKHFDEEKYKDYFKFGFVRNPWDRLVSTWKNKTKVKNPKKSNGYYRDIQGCTFDDFVCIVRDDGIRAKYEGNCIERHVQLQTELVPHDKLDYTGRIENFKEDFRIICDKIGISRQKFPRKNKSKHKHYTEYYDDETREIVAEKYAKDINLFGYKFGD